MVQKLHKLIKLFNIKKKMWNVLLCYSSSLQNCNFLTYLIYLVDFEINMFLIAKKLVQQQYMQVCFSTRPPLTAGLVLEFEMWMHFDKKTEIKIIYFVPLCLIVWFTLTLNFKRPQIFFLRPEADFFWSYVITQDICNKFIEKNFCVGCMVCL